MKKKIIGYIYTPKPRFKSDYNPEFSKLTRYVRSIRSDLFPLVSVHNTPITESLISQIKELKRDVPVNFR